MQIVKYNNTNNIVVKFVKENIEVSTQWGSFKTGNVKNVYDKVVFGVGFIGEGKYNSKEHGKRSVKYNHWCNMLKRCYDEKYHRKQPTYKNCIVSEEWHNFQNFAKWYDENYYEIEDERMELDKDILVKGNKIYSPNTCVYLPQRINSLFIKNDADRGLYPIGVHYRKDSGKFVAQCNDGSGKRRKLGSFSNQEETFLAYKSFKEQLIKQIAEKYKGRIPNILFEALLNYNVSIYD